MVVSGPLILPNLSLSYSRLFETKWTITVDDVSCQTMLRTTLQPNCPQYTSGSVLRFSLRRHGQSPKSFCFDRVSYLLSGLLSSQRMTRSCTHCSRMV